MTPDPDVGRTKVEPVRWSFSGKSESLPPPCASVLDALAAARGTIANRIDGEGRSRRADARELIHRHFIGVATALLPVAAPGGIVARRLSGDHSVPWEEAATAALRMAMRGEGTADERYARWSVALGLLSAHWVAGSARAVWTAERAWACRPSAHALAEEASLRASIERQIFPGPLLRPA